MKPSLALAALLAASVSAQIDPELLSAMKARSIGPAGMSGRVAAVDVVTRDPNVIWVGAATGGLWKSTNAGLVFEPVFDDQPVASIGAVSIFQASPDVVWIGTGEGNPRNSASVGNGVYRTLDGGETWTYLGLDKTERIHRIVLDPNDRDTAYAAAMGTTWGENPERGVYKTTDGGETWTQVLYVDERTGAADLIMDPHNPNKLFAAMWDHRRWPHFFRSGGPGSGLHVTHDGGETWTALTPEAGLPKGELGRIGLAFAPSDPRIVYALVEAKKSVLLRSDDGGVKWRTVNREDGVANRPFYYADLRVDPERPNRIYNLASSVTMSEDGGKSFSTISRGVHPDHHELWINPNDPRHLINGNDGGLAISNDRGKTWRFVFNLPLAQFYHIDVDMDVPYNVYGGLQDNGSWRGPSSVWENGGIRNHHWEEVGFGDGFRTLADPEDSTTGYAMSQQGYVHRWTLATGERRGIRPAPPGDEPLRFNWNAAIAIDPFDPATIYFGSQFVHRSKDRGLTWEALSEDLTTDNEEWQKQNESGGLTLDVTGAENFTSIITISPSPVQQGVLWVGTDDGRVHVSRDAGRSWTSVENNVPGVPANTWVPHIEPSRFDAGTAFVVFDDHRRSNWKTYVYQTTDYGTTWKSLAGDPLRGYALTLAQDPVDRNLLFLGTEFGLWVTVDGGEQWFQWKHGVPTVSCMALEIHPRDHDLIVGTHGRAAYVLDDISPLRGLTPEILRRDLHLFPVADAIQHRIKQTGASRFPANGEFRGDNEPYGAVFQVSVAADHLDPDRKDEESGDGEDAEAEGEDEDDAEAESEEEAEGDDEKPKKKAKPSKIEVTIFDAADEKIASFEHQAERGLNRVRWNLRRDGFRRPSTSRWGRSGGGPNGPEVPAGTYRAEFTFGESKAEATFRVLPDPRTEIADADRQAKWAAILKTGEWQEVLTDASDWITETRRDVEFVQKKIERAHKDLEEYDEKPHEALAKHAKELLKTLDELERELQGDSKVQGIGPRDSLSSKLGEASRSLPSTWHAPDVAQLRYIEVAREAIEPWLEKVNQAMADATPRFRQAVQDAGIAWFAERDPLALPK